MCGLNNLKVCLVAYLFLFLNFKVNAQHQGLPAALLPYYDQALNYDFRSWPLIDIDTIQAQDQPAAIYINSLAATIETIILKQDPATSYRDAWSDSLSGCEDNHAFCEYVEREVVFHKSVIDFLKGDYFKSFLNFRKVYRAGEDNNGYPWSLKTSGTIKVMLSAVPEQYRWILNILGYKGDHELGMKQLNQLISEKTFLTLETTMIKLLFVQYLYDQSTLEDWLVLRKTHTDSPLIQFLFNAIALKTHHSQMVIDLQVDSHIDQVYGQLGEAYLNKLEYDSALMYFKIYEDNMGEMATAEMLHKIWLCHKFNSNEALAVEYEEKLSKKEVNISEADENAIYHLQMNRDEDLELMKIRLTTDGGFYQVTEELLDNIDSTSLISPKSKVEYIYRKARWLHLTGKLEESIPYYNKVIAESPKSGWYFAPNSAYQLGLVFESLDNQQKALEYYELVSSYRQYPYQNSLENKSNLRMRLINSNSQ